MSNNVSTYRIVLPFGTFLLRCQLADAQAPIECNYDIDELPESWRSFGKNSASVRHSLDEAIEAAIEACGREWYAEPNDERESEDILEQLVAAAKVVAL